jgi:glutamate racemase
MIGIFDSGIGGLTVVRALLSKGAKIIVMACNTASSVATEKVAERFDVPIFEVITPAVELAVKTSGKSGIGVIGTVPSACPIGRGGVA